MRILLGATICGGVSLGAAPAQACGGPNPELITVFPADGATEVPTDVQPIIVGGGSGFALRTEAGQSVAIELTEVGDILPQGLASPDTDGPSSLASYGVRRLVPDQPLQPNTTYELTYGASEGDAGAPQVFEFTTGSESGQAPPSVPDDFDLTFYAVHGASQAACETPGQLELKGWDDGSLLEICVDYYSDDKIVDFPDWGEGVYCAQPEAGRRCVLANQPHFMLFGYLEFVLWVEQVEVRAWGLDGSVSEVRRLGREDFPQLEVDAENGLLPSAVESPVEIVLTGEGADTVREPEVCATGIYGAPKPDASESEDAGSGEMTTEMQAPPGEDAAPSARAEEELAANPARASDTEEPELRIRSNRCSFGATDGPASWWALGSLGLALVLRRRRGTGTLGQAPGDGGRFTP